MLDIYKSESNNIKEQANAIMQIELIIREYLTYKKKFFAKKPSKNWIYLYGTVGQGKTMIANLILEAFRQINSCFIHYLNLLTMLQNNQQKINADLIIIDEFEILDIVASKLVRDFLAQNKDKIIVFTSNKKPDDLYKNGLQRQMFLSAIEQIKNQALVIELKIGKDYRQDTFKQIKNFMFFKNINDARSDIYAEFLNNITEKVLPTTITVNNRNLVFKTSCKTTLYIDFDFLCNTPMGNDDYVAICKHFNTIFIGGFYNPAIENIDIVRRLIVFLDTAYLCKIKLIIGFDFDFIELNKFEKTMPEISRAISRLYELSSNQS